MKDYTPNYLHSAVARFELTWPQNAWAREFTTDELQRALPGLPRKIRKDVRRILKLRADTRSTT